MANRSSLPRKLEKAIFQQFLSRCPFCDESDIATVQKHEANNLILVCGNCHNRIETGGIPLVAVKRKKENASHQFLPTKIHPHTVIDVNNSNNQGIIADNVSINISSLKKHRVPFPTATIARDGRARNYTKYLIDRYLKFKEGEVGKKRMKYEIIYSSIKREFGAKWDHVPTSRFLELVSFLQRRIDRTIIGKKHKSKNRARYRTYEEYLEKYF
ncbi:MAG: hypothetical protein JKY17_03635 [Magnetovibrio sp.]|nr:hypothetical protein [Magnetovibrio sp.]